MATTAFANLYARITGPVVLLVGILGIVSQATGYYGYFGDSRTDTSAFLLWDYTHSAIHVGLGIAAIAAGYFTLISPLLFARVIGAVYVVLGVLGFVNGDLFVGASLGGLHVELGENIIHLALGAAGLVAGFLVLGKTSDKRKTAA